VGHVGVGEAVGGDDVFVGLSAVVDDGVDLIEVLGGAGADHAEVSSAKDEDCYAGDSRLRQGSSEMRFARGANAHLSDDTTVAKMGHPFVTGLDMGHPPTIESGGSRSRRRII
jgi:hypothetical protein